MQHTVARLGTAGKRAQAHIPDNSKLLCGGPVRGPNMADGHPGDGSENQARRGADDLESVKIRKAPSAGFEHASQP